MKDFYDICIVGGSGAGLSAAIRATESGAKVIVLEKMAATGGCIKMSGGIFGINSRLHKTEGKEFDPDALFREIMLIQNWNCNGKLVHKWLSKAQRNIDWLEDLGVEFNEVTSMNGIEDSMRRFHHVTEDRKTGLNIWKALTARCEKLGIEIIIKARATKLLQDDQGAVNGVAYTLGENSESNEIRSRAVILGTGSISHNKDLIARFYNSEKYRDMRIMANIPHNTGDGLVMAEAIGAASGNTSILYIGPHNHFPGSSEGVGCLPRRPEPIKVNRNGERFVDESISVNSEFGWMQSVAIENQPGKISYAILDEALLCDYLENRKLYGYAETRFTRFDKYPGEWFDKLRDDLKSEANAGRACICNTLEEAAAFIGCDVEALEETVSHYNNCCDNGYDDEFVKDPNYMTALNTSPYYVLAGPSGVDTFIGGLKIDHLQRVLDRDDRPIPGLFAAGVLTSGYLSTFYGFPGTENSYTLYSGQEAGYIATDYCCDVPTSG
jgi:fumarate reductase flavoprotein subunit